MRRIGKKIILLALAVSLMIFGGGIAEQTQEQAELHMLSDLLNYSYQLEKMYSDLLWAISYVEQFQENRDWDHLMLARAATQIAGRHIAACGLEDVDLTEEEYLMLLDGGEDVTHVISLKQQFQADQILMQNTCANLSNGLYDYIFYASECENYFQSVALDRQYILLSQQYNACMADYTVLQAKNTDAVERFNQNFTEYCPITAGFRDATRTSEALEVQAGETLDQIAEIENKINAVVGGSQTFLDILEIAIEKNDFSWFQSEFREVEGMPAALVMPDWFDGSETYTYYWKTGDEIDQMPVPGEELNRAPEGCMISRLNVPREEVEEFQQSLADLELPASGVSDTEEGLQLFWNFGQGTLSVHWTEEETIVMLSNAPLTLVPVWYFYSF